MLSCFVNVCVIGARALILGIVRLTDGILTLRRAMRIALVL